ncbi:MAG TPA: DUF6279 family lipoprotein [Nitrosospira sp.]|nr:DUF6279 family lipoprotein [Nitrosospira sp.]
MTAPSLKLAIVVLVLVLSTLAGCSVVRFGYNQADHLTYWWIDRFVDFNDAQKPRVREALAQWFSWHRRSHLPGYAALLVNSQNLVLEDITPERTCGLWTDLRGYMDSAFERALPMTAEFVLTLTPQQIQNIERRYAKINEEFSDEHLQSNEARRLKKSIKRTIERAEFFYGDLDKAQEAFIAEWVTRSPYDVNIWNKERHRRQQDLVQVLQRLNVENSTQDKAKAVLRAYLERIYSSSDENYRKYAEQVWIYNCAFVANLHNTMTVAQRKNAVKKLKDWESEIRALLPRTDAAQLSPSFP